MYPDPRALRHLQFSSIKNAPFPSPSSKQFYKWAEILNSNVVSIFFGQSLRSLELVQSFKPAQWCPMPSIWLLPPSPPLSQPVRALLRPLPDLARQPNDANVSLEGPGPKLSLATGNHLLQWQRRHQSSQLQRRVRSDQYALSRLTQLTHYSSNGIRYFNLMSIYDACTSKPLALRRVVVRSVRPSCLIRVPLILSTSSF